VQGSSGVRSATALVVTLALAPLVGCGSEHKGSSTRDSIHTDDAPPTLPELAPPPSPEATPTPLATPPSPDVGVPTLTTRAAAWRGALRLQNRVQQPELVAALALDASHDLYAVATGANLAEATDSSRTDVSVQSTWIKKFGPDGMELPGWDRRGPRQGLVGPGLAVSAAGDVYYGDGPVLQKFAADGTESKSGWPVSVEGDVVSIRVDGPEIVVLSHTHLGGLQPGFSVVRLTADGTVAAGFPATVVKSEVRAMAVGADHAIYVVGYTSSGWWLQKVGAGGALSQPWSIAAPSGTIPADVAVDAAGFVYVAGTASNLVGASSGYDGWVRRFGADGTETTSGWAKAFDTFRPYRLAIDAEGRLVVGGSELDDDQGFDVARAYPVVRRFAASGVEATDRRFGGAAGDQRQLGSWAFDADGTAYLAGVGVSLAGAASATDGWIKRYAPEGSEVATGWNKVFDHDVTANDRADFLLADGDGGVVVGGAGDNLFTELQDDVQDGWVKRYAADGSESPAGWGRLFDAHTFGRPVAAVVDAGKKLWLATARRGGGASLRALAPDQSASGVVDLAATAELSGLAPAAGGGVFAVGTTAVSGGRRWFVKRFDQAASEVTQGWPKTSDATAGTDDAPTIVATAELVLVGGCTGLPTARVGFVKGYATGDGSAVAAWSKEFPASCVLTLRRRADGTTYVVGQARANAALWVKKLAADGSLVASWDVENASGILAEPGESSRAFVDFDDQGRLYLGWTGGSGAYATWAVFRYGVDEKLDAGWSVLGDGTARNQHLAGLAFVGGRLVVAGSAEKLVSAFSCLDAWIAAFAVD
jgi:hypothetical protein